MYERKRVEYFQCETCVQGSRTKGKLVQETQSIERWHEKGSKKHKVITDRYLLSRCCYFLAICWSRKKRLKREEKETSETWRRWWEWMRRKKTVERHESKKKKKETHEVCLKLTREQCRGATENGWEEEWREKKITFVGVLSPSLTSTFHWYLAFLLFFSSSFSWVRSIYIHWSNWKSISFQVTLIVSSHSTALSIYWVIDCVCAGKRGEEEEKKRTKVKSKVFFDKRCVWDTRERGERKISIYLQWCRVSIRMSLTLRQNINLVSSYFNKRYFVHFS